MGDVSSSGSQPQGRDDRADFIRAAAQREAPMHRRLLESPKDGRILNAIMLRALAMRTPRGYAVLTTTGRKSGLRRRNYIRAPRRNHTVYAVMLRPPALAMERPLFVSAWVWNLRSDPRVSLRFGRRIVHGVAREIEDPNELEVARDAVSGRVHLLDYGEALLHLRGIPTRAKIARMHAYWFDTGIPVAIDLERTDGR